MRKILKKNKIPADEKRVAAQTTVVKAMYNERLRTAAIQEFAMDAQSVIRRQGIRWGPFLSVTAASILLPANRGGMLQGKYLS